MIMMQNFLPINYIMNIMIDDDETYIEYANYENKNTEYVYNTYKSLFSTVPIEKNEMTTNLFGWPQSIYTSTRATI